MKKILIANRGEIACRVIRTARKMNIATVAVYSDADRDALHVRQADEAVHIGPAPAAQSYLVIDTIIAAAKDTGADAIHPGYGFLSENPDFVRACEKAGITFIGPSAAAMEAMGLKDAAKALMSIAGVPVTPGYQGDNQDPDYLAKQAEEIGYPVLIKAVAGGGGKGMRKVEAASDFKAALASCQREAASSFGNDHVLIEKYIQSPRHIEVQVFGDTHGNVVHFFERDCSLQRRHQKVIEEAPAPGMTDEVREAMTGAAIRAAKAVNYVGAGTVEFIVDGSGALRTDGFWFMEMNTRLQVEHPVTEEITGYDLVELQIKVARGEKLPDQSEITMSGHAIEARLYAEDPANDFLPSIGHISHIDTKSFRWNSEYHVRIDTGVETGSYVSIYYDPMIAKVIGAGDTRDLAIDACKAGLSVANVTEIKTNTQFLINCLQHRKFTAGDVSTSFIQEYSDTLIWPDLESLDAFYALAAAHLFSGDADQLAGYDGLSNRTTAGNPAWRLNQSPRRSIDFMRGSEIVTAKWSGDTGDTIEVEINEKPHTVKIDSPESEHWKDQIECLSYWSFGTDKEGVTVQADTNYFAPFFSNQGFDLQAASSGSITAPMPGKVISILVSAGDAVEADQPVAIIEAMKMEMTLKAPRAGEVAEVGAEAGALVDDGQTLVSLKEEA